MSSAFRITQRSLATASLAGLQASLARLQETQTRLSSGKAIQRPSASPTGTMAALRLQADVDRYDQLDRNAADGLARLGTADNALTDGLATLREVRDAVVQGTNASLSANDREALAAQVDGLRQSLLAVANTKYLQQPIFATGYHQIEIMQARNQANQLDTKNHLSDVEAVDLPATTVDLQMQEVAYQAALGATAKAIQPSLVDFLR